MLHVARAGLESLLQAHRLDHTLTSARPAAPADVAACLPTGLTALDARMGGGLPRGQLSELIGPASSGRTSVLYRLLAEATRTGAPAALVDGLDGFDPASGDACGIALPHLLWIRGHVTGHPGFCHDLNQRALTQAITACSLVLQAGGFDLVALDLGGVPPVALRRVPFTTWLRLQRLIEGSRTACVLLSEQPIARSAGGLTLKLQPAVAAYPGDRLAGGRWLDDLDGASPATGRTRLFQGLAIEVQAVHARARWSERLRPVPSAEAREARASGGGAPRALNEGAGCVVETEMREVV
ncbi:MAG TPA: hypothetical protein VND92_06075 [Vicinamibacterales bacterium]|nr:hypothetical protein [Vicinamibacterales bacterium]